jgi:hypothetical protein
LTKVTIPARFEDKIHDIFNTNRNIDFIFT